MRRANDISQEGESVRRLKPASTTIEIGTAKARDAALLFSVTVGLRFKYLSHRL